MAIAVEKAVQAQEALAPVLPRVTISFCTQCTRVLFIIDTKKALG